MDMNSYTNADPIVHPIGQYWDAEGEYEFKDSIYTLLVYTPARPLPRYLPSFLARKVVTVSAQDTDPLDSRQKQPQKYSNFMTSDLSNMGDHDNKDKILSLPA
jgi:hypothetical protein